ncbi:MAG: hypothetical protein EHM41_00765 [Chloroflexi bacterium]|nr:MAG: hypothetical protein EHM41_00765 [Chloroflexota bacterium]
MSRIRYGVKAVTQLGVQSAAWFALYQLGKRSGHYERDSRSRLSRNPLPDDVYSLAPLIDLPSKEALEAVLGDEGRATVLTGAEEIISGKVRLFGSKPVSLFLSAPGSDLHWTKAEGSFQELPKGNNWKLLQELDLPVDATDVKFFWEPARFSWSADLFRAYLLTGAERFPEAFWMYFEEFEQANPPEYGLNWSSAQEVALRAVMFVLAAQVFIGSNHSTPERLLRLGKMVEASAMRIPPTIVYARAQRNNHLLSEALGLYVCGTALSAHPKAEDWRDKGWSILERTFCDQISREGVYIQQSTNYHRLMLQLALLVNAVGSREGRYFGEETRERLAIATQWLLGLVEPESGRVPNLGPNDGAYIFPDALQSFGDYRPVVQTAAAEFLGYLPFPSGPWDEMLLWLGGRQRHVRVEDPQRSRENSPNLTSIDVVDSTTVLRSPEACSWAYLRAARFNSRPGHADQLHLDLWWRGLNLTLDAGTFLYNGQAPWDNSLSRTRVHNTVTVDGLDQMTHAGRFLWLDWAQARLLDVRRRPDGLVDRIEAQHDGYRRLGILHRRIIEARANAWDVCDQLLSVGGSASRSDHIFRLHWLLPDLPWHFREGSASGTVYLSLDTPHGTVELEVTCLENDCSYSLARGGEILVGSADADLTRGWVSPTYAVKIPALSFAIDVKSQVPLRINSCWNLPQNAEKDKTGR